jgi:superfamily II DNA helicase RecQ
VDYEDNIGRGDQSWRPSYLQQAELRSTQIEHVIRFASSNACRMATLVGHFGDVSDKGVRCGICDFCAPESCVAERFRAPSEHERVAMDRVIEALRMKGPRATGKLYTEIFPGGEVTRNDFENILGAAVRSGRLSQAEEIFEKDGKRIPYRTVRLLSAQTNSTGENGHFEFVMKDLGRGLATSRTKKRKAKDRKTPASAKQKKGEVPAASLGIEKLERALKAWRLNEAKRRSVPAFRIFTDRALKSMVVDTPQSANQLSAISGLSTNFVKQYGDQICAVIRQHAV